MKEKQPETTVPVVLEIDVSRKHPLQFGFGYNSNVFGLTYRFNDPQFVEAMEASGASFVRFPGGTIANFYDWEKDDFISDELHRIEPEREVRRENYETEEAYRDMIDKFGEYVLRYANQADLTRAKRGKYGFADFLELAERVRAEVLYVANVNIAPNGKDPVDHIVDWMRKLKQDGIEVRYLELGNEINQGVQGVLNNVIDPVRYMQVCERASRQIKQIFPNVKIGIVAGDIVNRAGQDASRRDEENVQLFATEYGTDFFDAVILHTYLGLREHTPYDLTVKKDKLLAYAKIVSENAREYYRERFPGKEVWMTETGYFTNKSDGGEMVAAVFNAMFENDYLLQSSDNDDVVKMYIKHVALAPSHGGKSVLFEDPEQSGKLHKHVHYYGFSLVGGAIKNSAHRLGLNVLNDKMYVEDTVMFVPERDEAGRRIPGKGKAQTIQVEVGLLTTRAFLSRDGSRIYVPFVNKSRAPREVRLEGKGIDLRRADVDLHSISGALADKNTPEEPFKIVPRTEKVAGNGTITLPGYSTGVIVVDIGEEKEHEA